MCFLCKVLKAQRHRAIHWLVMLKSSKKPQWKEKSREKWFEMLASILNLEQHAFYTHYHPMGIQVKIFPKVRSTEVDLILVKLSPSSPTISKNLGILSTQPLPFLRIRRYLWNQAHLQAEWHNPYLGFQEHTAVTGSLQVTAMASSHSSTGPAICPSSWPSLVPLKPGRKWAVCVTKSASESKAHSSLPIEINLHTRLPMASVWDHHTDKKGKVKNWSCSWELAIVALSLHEVRAISGASWPLPSF